MYISKKSISRRTVLRGIGAALALPFLDSMVPALTPFSKTEAVPKARFVAIEMVHGAAGSTPIGRAKNYWSPAKVGRDFELGATLKDLEPLRDYLTIISNTDLHNAMSLRPDEDGPMADHARSSSVFLTAAHPRRTSAEDILSGPSVDQLYAQSIGRETAIPSLQLCIEDPTLTGACGYDYSCSYTHTISWASPTRPMPMERSPRAVFDRLIEADPDLAAAESAREGSKLDGFGVAIARLKAQLGVADRNRLGEFLEFVRDVEKRIQQVENQNLPKTAGAMMPSTSVPDSFDEHVQLMFDLQLIAFQCDLTRVVTLKMGVDRSQRAYPESGVNTPFHTLSHHGEDPVRIEQYARLNRYHVSKVASFLERLRTTTEADGNLLDHSLVLYGSPMGDSDIHSHKCVPLFLAGHASGKLKGKLHVSCADETPTANALLTVLHKLEVESERIGDSTATIEI